MGLRAIAHRTGIAALAAGLAAAGALALPAAPASAAAGNVTITLRATMFIDGLIRYPGASVYWYTAESWPWAVGTSCTRVDFGQAKDIEPTVPKGAIVDVR